MTPSSKSICEFDGHEWGEAGGGLLICLRCEAEKWADLEDDLRRINEAVAKAPRRDVLADMYRRDR